LQIKAAEKIKTHILRSTTFFRKSYHLWDNVEKYGRKGEATDAKNILKHKRFACWITKDTDTRSEYNTLLLFHDNNGYGKASHCYVIRTLCLVLTKEEFLQRGTNLIFK